MTTEQTRKHLNIPISPDLHRAAKVAAARQGVTLQTLVQDALKMLITEKPDRRVKH